jgi:serine/threonine protein kinase
MNYYPGGELFGVLKRYKRMSEGMARYYITEILFGL